MNAALVLAQGVQNQMSTGESISFWVLGPLALFGALGMIFARNAVHSALFLVLTMLSLGVLYMVQQAPFLGFVQIIVYTGAIMMLFLFVLMLVGRDSSDSVVEVLRGQRLFGTILGIGLAVLIVAAVARSLSEVTPTGLQGQEANGGVGNVENIGRSIFTDWLFPFELTSALLITAAVGAMVLGYVDRHTRGRKTQKEMVEARFRGEHDRPSPLPGPGVFATSSSVATPALLPDGSIAPESLSRLIESAAADSFDDERKAVAGGAHAAEARALNPTSEGETK
ncbi:NADH-quinone oxidoreductase subunit J [Actinophytocola algeriensis]|uniref:NADH-quinone oxidoreductase subunit J n=1 Tax=Actinophytocola algeriensis TaxID=1768010 RepID=A0A7W7QCX3_9PSEU|nr:NADH-quinone oxidoreductase subunit J [Actinophytocola algeriensis]MBB4911272.1 NADH-quinone oxidoreductase subunit J [Actinophytocola algeriensis]MBE1479211.1 NADH-quinone oxidoreductase subunit J [Actinophytocola algeriensis]